MSDTLNWIYFYTATLVTYSVLFTHAIAKSHLKTEWFTWYEMNLKPVFDTNRIANFSLQSFSFGASSIGFFFLLKNNNGNDASWNIAVASYTIMGISESIWPIMLWNWKKPTLAYTFLITALVTGGITIWFALFATDMPGLVILPITPRVGWLAFLFGYDFIYLKKKLKDTQTHKEDPPPSVPIPNMVQQNYQSQPNYSGQQNSYIQSQSHVTQRNSPYGNQPQRSYASRQQSAPEYSTRNSYHDVESQRYYEEPPIELPENAESWEWGDEKHSFILVTLSDGSTRRMMATTY